MAVTFTVRAKRHFQFLIGTYGFVISSEEVSDRDPEMEGVVTYSSQTTFVVIDGGMGSAGVRFGRRKDAGKSVLDVRIVYEYKVLNAKEKAIVLSFDPKDDVKASKIIESKGLPWGGRLDDAMAELERQLAEDARWLRKYADPFLRGDFSRWLEINEYWAMKTRAEYARRHNGKDDVEWVMKRGEDGVMRKLGEKTLAQDYLEELRKEYAEESASGKSSIQKWLEKALGKK